MNQCFSMEHTGFEPVASTMRMLRAPNCANAPQRNRLTVSPCKAAPLFKENDCRNKINPLPRLLLLQFPSPGCQKAPVHSVRIHRRNFRFRLSWNEDL